MRRNRQEALAKLSKAKKGEESRISQYRVQESKDMIIELPEEEYKKLVAERSKNNFIEEDLEIGYNDKGEFDLEYEDEESFEEDVDKADEENEKPSSQSITKFMKQDIAKKPKLAPKLAKESRENIKKSIFDMLEDDNLDEGLILTKAPKLPQKPKTLGKGDADKTLNKQYSTPIGKLEEKAPQKIQESKEPPLLQERQSENLKRSEPGAVPKPEITIDVIPPSEPSPPDIFLQPEISLPEEITEPQPEEMEIEVNPIETLSLDKAHELPIENGSIHMYWIDAFEDKDLYPGGVFLFGKIYLPKVKEFTGICVYVSELTRCFYALPNNQESFQAADAELEEYLKRAGVRRRAKKAVQRRYAFELPNIPAVGNFIKVTYSSKLPCVEFGKLRSISHIFGAKRNLVELLLVKRKLKGPCWIKLNNPQPSKNKISNSRIEVVIQNFRDIEIGVEEINMPPPPLITMSLSACFKLNKKNENEVVSISGCVHSCFDQSTTTSEERKFFSFFNLVNSGNTSRSGINETTQTEAQLLTNFLEKVQNVDPDILICHDLFADVLDKLSSRIIALSPPKFSSLGRLLRTKTPSFNKTSNFSGNYQLRALTAGRLLLDTLLSSKELTREKTYTLSALSQQWFNLQRKEPEFDLSEIVNNREKTQILANCTRQDAELVHKIVVRLNVIPLTKQLTNIAGNLWARSLQSQRAERNEMLLIHEFSRSKFIIPDKIEKKFETKNERKKNQYSGGKVLTPLAGLYDKVVVLLDFNSLYPSIIREYNICFTTVSRSLEGEENNEPGSVIPDSDPGILPRIIADLVNKRRDVKRTMQNEKDPVKKKQLDIKQMALKLTANSMYGCLGFKQSRFYARAIAALITQIGRRTLERAVTIAKESLNLEVIYGDTDSIMINTGLEDVAEALKKANELKKLINKQAKHLEIEVDGIFISMLLLKKKKYAAIKIEGGVSKREVKGLDMVRRDWCDLSKNISSRVLDLILSKLSKEDIAANIKAHIEKFYQDFDSFPLGDFIIYKQLTKTVDKYKDAENQPHVQVAIRLIEKGERNLQKHFIPYVICEGSEANIAQRAFHPDEVVSSMNAKRIDKRWYINQQLIPPLARLIEPIDIIKIDEIVQLLGEDPLKYRSVAKDLDTTVSAAYIGKPVLAKCYNPEHKAYDVTQMTGSLNCPLCPPAIIAQNYVKNAMISFLKQKLALVYKSQYKCSVASCTNVSSLKVRTRCNKPNCDGKMIPAATLKDFNLELGNMTSLEERLKNPLGPKTFKNLLEKSKYSKVNLKNFIIPQNINYDKVLI